MKQETLAEALGVTQQAVSKMELGKGIVVEKLKRLAEILGVSVEDIKKFNENLVIHNICSNHEKENINNLSCHLEPCEKITQLYERILNTKQNMILTLEVEVMDLKKKLKELGG